MLSKTLFIIPNFLAPSMVHAGLLQVVPSSLCTLGTGHWVAEVLLQERRVVTFVEKGTPLCASPVSLQKRYKGNI